MALEIPANGAAGAVRISRAPTYYPGSPPVAVAAWDHHLSGENLPSMAPGTRSFLFQSWEDPVARIIWHTEFQVTAYANSGSVPANSLAVTPQQAGELTVWEQVRDQLIGGMTAPPAPAGPPSPSNRKLLRLRRTPIDTNLNGLPDWFELVHGFNPFRSNGLQTNGDYDGDGLTDFQELQSGTSPTAEDSDGDGALDNYEVQSDTDPQNAEHYPPLLRWADLHLWQYTNWSGYPYPYQYRLDFGWPADPGSTSVMPRASRPEPQTLHTLPGASWLPGTPPAGVPRLLNSPFFTGRVELHDPSSNVLGIPTQQAWLTRRRFWLEQKPAPAGLAVSRTWLAKTTTIGLSTTSPAVDETTVFHPLTLTIQPGQLRSPSADFIPQFRPMTVPSASAVRIQDLIAELLPPLVAVDADGDGVVNYSMDHTSQARPYVFWVNNDRDVGDNLEGDDESTASANDPTDAADATVDSLRDLEDFARLKLRVPLPVAELSAGAVQLVVKFRNTTGQPAIKLWPHVETTGLRAYLEDASLTVPNRQKTLMSSLVPVTVDTLGGEKELSAGLWSGSASALYPAATEFSPDRTFLFEGAGAGSGELVFEARRGTQVIGQIGSVWLDLRDIGNMYEHYACAGVAGKTWEQIQVTEPDEYGSAVSVPPYAFDGIRPDKPFTYPAPTASTSSHEKSYILFVHGWRMQPEEKTGFGNTAFKRLWHRGYRGRFGTFEWPTEWTNTNKIEMFLPDGIVWDPRNFDRSERKAYLSGNALRQVLHQLKATYSAQRVHLMAHSMGNVVASEALRLETRQPSPQVLVHSYNACQAAMAAHAYDNNGPQKLTATYIRSRIEAGPQAAFEVSAMEDGWMREVYGHHPTTLGDQEYFSGIDRVTILGINNFHNRRDYALGLWLANQWQKPDENYNYSDIWFDGQGRRFWRQEPLNRVMLNLHNDSYEIFAHAAEAKSPPLGAAVGDGYTVGKVITINVDCGGFVSSIVAPENFQDKGPDHSAQFRGIIMHRNRFWDRLLEENGITKKYPVIPISNP